MQVVATLAVVAYTVMAVTGCSGPAAIVLGGGLALSSTAVAMQVCYCSSVQRVVEVSAYEIAAPPSSSEEVEC